MKKKSACNNTVEAILRPPKVYGRHPRLYAAINALDKWAANVAREIGRALYKDWGWENLGWFFTQYRGTILSGGRAREAFFCRRVLGSKQQNEELLKIYWKVYGLGSTIGEIFEAKCLLDEADTSKTDRGRAFWQLLLVDLVESSACGENNGTLNLKFECRDTATNGIRFSVTHMSVGHRLIDELLPNEAWEMALNLINGSHAEHSKNAEDRPNDKEFEGRLNSAVNKQVGDIMYAYFGRDDLDKIREFVSGAQDTRHALDMLLKALQLLGLYWRWTKANDIGIGPLVVCVPRPYQEEGKGLQPRLGFAAMFINGEQKAKAMDLCKSLIGGKWQPALNEAAETILSNRGGTVEGDVMNLAREFGDNDKDKALVGKVASLHLGREHAANLLLERLLPILKEVDRLSDDFVHEGRRFGVTIFVGLSYHEQVIEDRLGSVNEFITDFEKKVPKKVKVQRGEGEHWKATDLLRPLIHSCYSLLDWDGVALFAKFEPNAKDMVRFLSLHRLPESVRRGAPSEIFRRVTKQHTGLFIISVDRGAAIRVYYGGHFLLSKHKGEWKIGAAEKDLRDNIVKTLNYLQVKVECEDDLEPFARLLLRISEEPGAGAAFVICGDFRTKEEMLSMISPPPRELWHEMLPFSEGCSEQDKEIFYRLSIMDGATGIVLGNGQTFKERWANAKVHPRLLMTQKFDIRYYWERYWQHGTWKEWLRILSYGSRHIAGLAVTMGAKEKDPPLALAVILVSADGPVTFMIGGEEPVVARWP